MPTELRDKVFIWPSWISKLVAGEVQCEWAYWFKAHYKSDKKSTDFNLARWTMNHNRLIKTRKDELEKLGFKVYIEDQNSFRFTPQGKNYVISGKADIVAIGQEDNGSGIMVKKVLVDDCKTGSCKTSDFVQVVFYMLMLPVAHPNYKGLDFAGTVVYKEGIKNQKIPETAKDDLQLKAEIWAAINLIAGSEEHVRKVPSVNECKHCDICAGDCPDRLG